MLNAILMSVIGFLETVATYSIGAVFITFGVWGRIAGCRWLMNERDPRTGGRAARMLRHGTGSLALVAVLATGLTAVLAGLLIWSR